MGPLAGVEPASSSLRLTRLGNEADTGAFRQDVICLNCSKVFSKSRSQIRSSPNHYCSKSCAATINNSKHPKHLPKPRICRSCSSGYVNTGGHTSPYNCVECTEKVKQSSERNKIKTLGEIRASMPSTQKGHGRLAAVVRGYNRSWNADIVGLPCQRCGYAEHTELCHKKAIASFPMSATLGEVNARDNLLVLCPNHHWEFDNGVLLEEDITPLLY